MDGGNLGRAEFLKTVTKEQPGWRLCLCGGRRRRGEPCAVKTCT